MRKLLVFSTLQIGLVMFPTCGENPPTDPCVDLTGGPLVRITVVDDATDGPVEDFTAWVILLTDDFGDGTGTRDTLESNGSVAEGVEEPSEYYAWVEAEGYELWRSDNFFIDDGECGPEAVELEARLIAIPEPAEIALGPDEVDIAVGYSQALSIAVRDITGTIIQAPTTWAVRDSSIAELFGYDSTHTLAPPLVYGSAEGETWAVVRSGEIVDSVPVTVAAAPPMDVNEGAIETNGEWTRHYRVSVSACVRDYLDEEGAGGLTVSGWTDHDGTFLQDAPVEGFFLRLPGATIETGTHALSGRDLDGGGYEIDESLAVAGVYVQLSHMSHSGGWSRNSQYYDTEARATATVDSVRTEPDALPVVFGGIAMDSAREYTVVLSDVLQAFYVETGRWRDVGVEFAAQVDYDVEPDARVEVVDGPHLFTDSRAWATVIDHDVLRITLFGSAAQPSGGQVQLTLHYPDPSVGTASIGSDTSGVHVTGSAGVWPDDLLDFHSDDGTIEVTEIVEGENGYPTVIRGSLEVTGALTDDGDTVVDSLEVHATFAAAIEGSNPPPSPCDNLSGTIP